MNRLLLLNGPNLNMLGKREPGVYGNQTLEEIVHLVKKTAAEKGFEVEAFQSNHEGELVDLIQQADGKYEGIIFNPAAYTHTSIALRDAISAVQAPVIEVHISNVHAREEFRHHSMLAPVCRGQIVGIGISGYRLAALALMEETDSEGSS
ncbi:type II 3-dehydroquinate dehydratase [Thalassobacillus pellis]|uniref:type II 3-dehydroquinate dehydratase n=1 Tax=Thalassobacillus pellis TaxID=748008 RepID=UPI0019621576|nr:type II 3-dehydroquinate dehydratase [Thalassobacillus pellis]MBM7552323.1 3-dehydroquinate dehydratase-2 [Thalassobacillus pellis]